MKKRMTLKTAVAVIITLIASAVFLTGCNSVSVKKQNTAVVFDDPIVAAIKYMQKLLFMSGFFRPERALADDGADISTADRLQKAIAASRLDELPSVAPEREVACSALTVTVDKFEQFFFCEIASARYFTGRKKR